MGIRFMQFKNYWNLIQLSISSTFLVKSDGLLQFFCVFFLQNTVDNQGKSLQITKPGMV